MNSSFNEEISRKFCVKRLKKEYRKNGLKTNLGKKQTLDLPDAKSTEKYIWSFIDAVKDGIGDSVPQECIKNVVQRFNKHEQIDITGLIDLLSEKEYKLKKVKIACSFALRLSDCVVQLCCSTFDEITITFNEIYFRNPLRMKNLVCDNPELIGKVMVGLYKTSDEDNNRCEIEIAKANKVKQIVGVGLETILKNHFKDTDLNWQLNELHSGEFCIKVKLVPELVLTIYIDPLKFDNNFEMLTNTIDVLDNIIRRKQTGLDLPSKQHGVAWHILPDKE